MKNLRLATLQAVPAPFDASKGEAGLPTRFRVLPWGDNATAKGQVICNETTLSAMPGYMKSQNWDEVPLDFEHNTVPGTPAYSPTAKVAGYGPLEIVSGDGIYITMSSWTTDGKTLAGGGHYKDLSATVILNESNEVIGVHSVALCRHGAAPGAIFLSAWPVVEQRPPQTADELFSALKTALGAAHDATPSQVVETLTSKLMADDPTKKDDPTKVEKKAADSTAVAVETLSTQIADLTKLVTPLADSVKTLSAELKTLKDESDKREREVILSTAASQGKEVPASAKELPLATLKTLCSELPATIPLERRTPTTVPLSSTPGVEDEISKLAGVSAEDITKYGKL